VRVEGDSRNFLRFGSPETTFAAVAQEGQKETLKNPENRVIAQINQ
jgi:hypothetical protein